MKYAAMIAGLGALGALAACMETNSMPGPDEGHKLYMENCVQCHGPAGKGDGPWAKGMTPKPADLTTLSARYKFPRARILSTIDGYHRAQLPGQQMPEFGLLLQGETVPVPTGDGVMTPTPRPLAALLSYIESIQRS